MYFVLFPCQMYEGKILQIGNLTFVFQFLALFFNVNFDHLSSLYNMVIRHRKFNIEHLFCKIWQQLKLSSNWRIVEYSWHSNKICKLTPSIPKILVGIKREAKRKKWKKYLSFYILMEYDNEIMALNRESLQIGGKIWRM